MSLLIFIVIISIGFRITMGAMFTLGGQNYLGVDGSTYLQQVHVYLGNVDHTFDFMRPPLAPGFQLMPFVLLFGDKWGLIIWGAIVGALPGIGIWMLAKQANMSSLRTYLVTGFVLFEPFSQHLWWAGGAPMTGTFLNFVALWGIREATLKGRIITIASVAVIPVTNFPLFPAAGLVLGAYWLLKPDHYTFKTLILSGMAGLIMFVPFATNVTPLSEDYRSQWRFVLDGENSLEIFNTMTTWWWIFAGIISGFIWHKYEIWPAILYVVFTTFTVIIFTSEPIYNIPLRGAGMMALLAFLAVARWGSWRWLLPAGVLIVLAPFIHMFWYSGGFAEVMQLAAKVPPENLIRANHRVQAYYIEYEYDRHVGQIAHIMGVPNIFRQEADEVLCLLGQGALDSCPTQDEYWIVRDLMRYPWWHPNNLWFGYEGNYREDLPCWFEHIETKQVEFPWTLSIDVAYIMYRVNASKDCAKIL